MPRRRMHETEDLDAHQPEIEEPDDEERRPSRSAEKRRAELAEKVGLELTRLVPERLAQMPLSDDVKDAIREYNTISARGGGRRQLQYIGRLMRDVDVDAVQAALAAVQAGDRAEARKFQIAEDWRRRLLDDDAAVDEFRDQHGTDLQDLVERARRERAKTSNMTHRRALFRAIRDVLG